MKTLKLKKQLIKIAGNKVTGKVNDKMTQELTQTTAEPRVRAVRRDKGQLITTPRDLVLLTWINEQQAISIDHLQILIARHTENKEELNNPKMASQPVASKLISRWLKLQYIETAKINNRQWVWLSAKGIKNLDLEYGYYEPALYNHIHEVNKVRLYWEVQTDKKGKPIEWTPERYIRKTYGKGHRLSQHFPDGEILFNGNKIAIEVELSVKRGADKKKIADKYAIALSPMQHGKSKGLFGYHYEGLFYYTNEKTHESVMKLYEKVEGAVVRKLSDIQI